MASEIYRRLKSPHVPVEETDVLFTIGLVFFPGVATVIAVAVIAWAPPFGKDRALATPKATAFTGPVGQAIRQRLSREP